MVRIYLPLLLLIPNEAWERISDNSGSIFIVEIGPSSAIDTIDLNKLNLTNETSFLNFLPIIWFS